MLYSYEKEAMYSWRCDSHGRSNSRIPDASFGTAEEDALRRDFTLNSLFYNVNSGEVEDMTGRSDINRIA